MYINSEQKLIQYINAEKKQASEIVKFVNVLFNLKCTSF